MSSAVNVFVHAIRKRSKKCLAQKVGRFGSPGWIPMIQPPFSRSWVALQYETGTKNFHRAVPELHANKIDTKFTFQRITKYCVHIQHTISIAFLGHTELSRYQKLSWYLLLSQPASSTSLAMITASSKCHFNLSSIDSTGNEKFFWLIVHQSQCMCVREERERDREREKTH